MHNFITQPNVVELLRDYDWFRTTLSLEYRDISKAYGCTVVMAGERLLQTFDIFWEDMENGLLRHLPVGTTSLNQFKIAAYLCFWLRRINPVRQLRMLDTLGGRQRWFDGGERANKLSEDFSYLAMR
jgi:predicted phosphoadenosine phosphosulfate sulfurtransferase